MPHSIRAQFEQLHRKIHQLIWLDGLCRGLNLFLILALSLISFDWILNISDPVIRLFLSLTAGGFIIGLLWNKLVIPLKIPLTDFDLALKIERQHPALKDRFASSIQFDNQQTSQFSGSQQLRQAVIDDAYQRASRINFLELVDTQPIRKIMMITLLLCLVVASISILHPRQVSLGIHRLILPFSAPDWPQKVELLILDENLVPIETGPQNQYQVVEGESFRFFVANQKGAPPKDLRVEYQSSENETTPGKSHSERLRIVSVPGPSGMNRDLGTGSLLISRKKMKLRAVGGDDTSMKWLDIISVPPTTIELQQVRLFPPPYTQRPVEKLPEGIGNFKALVDTRVEFKASSNKRLKSAILRVKNQEPVSLKLDTNRKHFSGSFSIEEPGTYSFWFEVENDQGFKPPSPKHYEITAISDAVPEVYLEKPDSDLQVTPDAQIPLVVAIHDDFSIDSALIRYQKSSKEESLARALRTDRESQSFPLPLDPQSSGEQLILTHNWNLSKLPLIEGDRIIFRAEALDHYSRNVSPDGEILDQPEIHIGTSISRVLTIVSPEYKAKELANRHANLLEELTRVIKDQRLLHTEVKDVQHQLQRVGTARAEEIDTIKQVEMDQKRVTSQLFRPRTGLEQRSKELVNELEWNHIDDPVMNQRLSELSTELAQLNQNVFPQIQEQITQARKKIQSKIKSNPTRNKSVKQSTSNTNSTKPDTNTKLKNSNPPSANSLSESGALKSLNIAEKGQQLVINRLERVLNSLSQWQNARDLVSELDEQIQQQSEIQSQTEKLAKKTITKSFGKLKVQEQADLEKLAARQEQQAENFKAFRNLLDSLNSQTNAATEEEQFQKQAAIDFMRKKSIPDEMRQTAQKLKQNQVGQAIQEQQKIQQSMRTLKEFFEDQITNSTDQFVKKLKQSEKELTLLKQQQQDILQKLQTAKNTVNQKELKEQLQKLVKREQELKQKLKEFEQQLKRLNLQQAAQSIQRARNRNSKITDALQQENLQDAQKQIQETLDDLEQAQRELAIRRKEAEESLAFEEIAKLGSVIRSLIERQEAVIQETSRLEQQRLSRGRLSRSQLKSLKQLLEIEQDLRDETVSLTLKLEAAPVFVLALENIIDQLEIAVVRLDERLTDEKTLKAEQVAKSKLLKLSEILDEKSQQDSALNSEVAYQDENSSQSNHISLVTQLKLLKLLQENILNRTKSFNNSISQGNKLSSEQILQRNKLSKEQAALAELSMELLARLNQNPSEKPESKLELNP
ncbi:MAG: hypothetical protein QM501_07655 [Gimesia sp.]